MNYLNKNHLYLPCLLLIIFSYSCVYSNNINAEERDTRSNQSNESELLEALKELKLSIAVVVSKVEASSKLAFIAKNNSNIDITIDEFYTGYNGVEIINPDGKSTSKALQTFPGKQVTIKSSDTKIWYIDPAIFFVTRSKDEGVYKIKWNIGDVVESKEVLLLKEIDKKENLETDTQK